jgi:hypothetical protein
MAKMRKFNKSSVTSMVASKMQNKRNPSTTITPARQQKKKR